MNDMSPQQIAAWHRAEAKKHLDLANFHKRTADTIDPASGDPRQERRPVKVGREGQLTLQELEKALGEKGGRVNHLAARLAASEEEIWNLLDDPACKWAVGDRGFIYPKKLTGS